MYHLLFETWHLGWPNGQVTYSRQLSTPTTNSLILSAGRDPRGSIATQITNVLRRPAQWPTWRQREKKHAIRFRAGVDSVDFSKQTPAPRRSRLKTMAQWVEESGSQGGQGTAVLVAESFRSQRGAESFSRRQRPRRYGGGPPCSRAGPRHRRRQEERAEHAGLVRHGRQSAVV